MRKTHEREETKKHKAPGDKEKFSMLAVPNIVEVSKDKWEDMEPPFSSLDALRVRQDGDGGYDFYLNIDNSFLLTEMSRNGVTEKELIKYWFKYGLVLCGLGMIQNDLAESSLNGRSGGDDGAEEVNRPGDTDGIDLVNAAMPGLARVIIPLVRSLSKLLK